ncbi:MAG: phage tail tape measure protein [Candidatus Nitronauta litoralis]|uniref:Phage tail tape measure protein n=1 Tax=Candidatus Nitronauta litoralis TaxID=2705533 RepID=A0A7T0BVL3_9BACT|nr:MAG: phage tail tape measure protein [Candidatus Nitronauta litoralis]
MADKAAELSIIMRAKDQATKIIRPIQKQLLRLRAFARDNAAEIARVGKAALATSAAAGVLFTAGIVQAANFQQSMADVNAIVNATPGDLQKISASAREMGATTAFAASEAATAQFLLAQSGQKTGEIIETLPAVIALASAQSLDLAFATTVVTDALGQFQLQADQSARVSNVLAAATSNSKTNLSQLQLAMRQSAPIAASLGLSIEQTVGALAGFAQGGTKGEQAGTKLRTVISRLIAPAGEAAEILEKNGISAFNAQGEFLSFVDILKQFEAANLSAADIVRVFGEEGGPGLVTLLSVGSAEVDRLTNAITGTNEAARQAKARLDSLAGDFKILKSAVEEALISIGEFLLPVLRGLVTIVNKVVDIFNSLPKPIQQFIVVVGLAVTAATALVAVGALLFAVLSPLIAAFGGIAAAVTGLGITLIALTGFFAAFIDVVIGLGNNLTGMGTKTDDVTDALNKMNKKVADTREESKNLREEIEKVKQQNEELKKTQDKLNSPEHLEAVKKIKGQLAEEQKTVEELKKELEKVKEVREGLLEVTEAETKAIEKNTDAVKQAVVEEKRLAAEKERLKEKMEAEKKAAQELDRAFSTLGIQNLTKEAEDLNKAFETIQQSGTVSGEDTERAYEALQLRLEELTDTSNVYRDGLQQELDVLQRRRAIVADALQGEIAARQAVEQMLQRNVEAQERSVQKIKEFKNQINQIAVGREDILFEVSIKGLDNPEKLQARIQKVARDASVINAGGDDISKKVSSFQKLIDMNATFIRQSEAGSQNEKAALAIDLQLRNQQQNLIQKQTKSEEQNQQNLQSQSDQLLTVKDNAIAALEPLQQIDEAIKNLKLEIDTKSLDEAVKKAQKTREKFESTFGKPITQIVKVVEQTGKASKEAVKKTDASKSDGASGGGKSSGGSGEAEASFAVGVRNVPRNMLAQLHKGEAVLNRDTARNFRAGAFKGAGASFGDININLPPGATIDRNTVRRFIIPELKKAGLKNAFGPGRK